MTGKVKPRISWWDLANLSFSKIFPARQKNIVTDQNEKKK